MDVLDLFHFCRIGDVENTRNLVEEEDVDVNVRDCWDSTPLYYACLCGHEALVAYLLSIGARCEPNTFDGERCLYAALTDRIRKILQNYKAITSTCMRRNPYYEFLRRTLESGDFADVCFVIHGQRFCAHRAILTTRSSYFASMFETKWKDKHVITLKNSLVKPWAFKALLNFIYMDRLDVDVSQTMDVLLLAKQCKLHVLKQLLEMRLRDIEMMSHSKPGTHEVKVISVEPDASLRTMQGEYGQMAEIAIPQPYRQQFFFPFSLSLPNDDRIPGDLPSYTDICINVQGNKFFCHKMFLCGRSDYFRALLIDHFAEVSTEPNSIPELALHDVTPEVFAAVVSFVYRDNAELTDEILYNVLCAADIYLLHGLKRLCEHKISGLLDRANVLTVLRTARLFSLDRLEMNCCDFLAGNIAEFIDSQDFHELILEDAAAIRNREETDSIPIVDDLRFHLYKNILPNDGSGSLCLEGGDAEVNLLILNNILEKLGLDC
ncbi:predicted protein [Nematostella vectensis]|uniref:BTB domain-containing protein n=1 Tax=Nematostella vectensis TaxID=45351 RepID=A7RTA9_NEMVE|nr:predicted protein [Nematostella vectensis]|eukprot:XP_001637410.1 predicted protein [Nematostella vectensis]